MFGPRFEPPKITAPALEIAVKGIPNRKIFRLRRASAIFRYKFNLRMANAPSTNGKSYF